MNDTISAPDPIAARQHWMAVLARAPAAAIEAGLARADWHTPDWHTPDWHTMASCRRGPGCAGRKPALSWCAAAPAGPDRHSTSEK